MPTTSTYTMGPTTYTMGPTTYTYTIGDGDHVGEGYLVIPDRYFSYKSLQFSYSVEKQQWKIETKDLDQLKADNKDQKTMDELISIIMEER